MSAATQYLEHEYWTRFLDGDKSALDSIVKAHYNLLYNYSRKFTADTELVKDCIQDLFLSLWKNRETIGDTPSVRNYLLKAMRRRLQSAMARHQAQHTFEFLPIHEGRAQSPEADRVQREAQMELNQKIVQAFTALSRRQQEIIYLRFYLDADAEEIAQIMGLNRQSIYNLLSAALERLKEISTTLFEQKTALAALFILLES